MSEDDVKKLEALARAVAAGLENPGELTDSIGAREIIWLIESARLAERKGAAEMRERAAQIAASMPERMGLGRVPYRACAMDTEAFIRNTLLLPGEGT